jgi:Fur family ferric uptake transcriptional regulator
MTDARSLEDRLRDYMDKAGLKHTRQRQAIFEAFIAQDAHRSLDELLALVQGQMPGVGYATVYRTMKLLTEAGVAHERQFGDGQTRYEPARPGDDHHDHLICRDCGQIFEFEDHEIEARQARIAAAHGLHIRTHRLDIWGDCQDRAVCPRFAAAQGRVRRGAAPAAGQGET